MPSSFKKRAVLDCCCGFCIGCCFPIDYTNPTYPDGVLQNLTLSLSVPHCPSLDGTSVTMYPSAPTNPSIGACGACAVYLGGPIQLLGTRPAPLLYCSTTPCSFNVCFRLTCFADTSVASGLDECCGRMRLWIGSSETQAEDDGSSPLGGGQGECTSWKLVSPSQCSCGESGPAMRFPFSVNTTGPAITSGPCAGETDCCTPNCDFTDAEVVI